MVLEAREKKGSSRSSEYENLKPGGKGCKRKDLVLSRIWISLVTELRNSIKEGPYFICVIYYLLLVGKIS